MDLSDNNSGKNGALRQSVRDLAGHVQAGRLSEAEALCRKILRDSPREAGIHHLLGVLNHQLGKNEEARKEFESAIALNPNDAEYHNNLGVVLLGMGKAPQALAACAGGRASSAVPGGVEQPWQCDGGCGTVERGDQRI